MRKIENSPGQLCFFRVEYSGKKYLSLKEAMINAMQDFYICKKYPDSIFFDGKKFTLKAMKRYWVKYCLFDVYL